jgi:multidrug efflux pump subunit AcrB
VEIPYFATVLRGGDSVVSKRVGTVTLSFADGQERAEGQGTAAAYVSRAEATLPPDIRERITRKRKAGDTDAAVDPLTEPDVRAALARASFELLVGFQMTDAQLAYNATR